MNNNLKKIIVSAGVAVAVVGAVIALPSDQIRLENARKIQWDKPLTNAGWAEDVKQENLDIKSTPVLEIMIDSHTAKLQREEERFAKFLEMEAAGQNPVQYLYWEYLENLRLSYPNEPSSWHESEALKQAQEQFDRELWSIEKLRQSVERMNKEVELRDKGFVVVEGEGRASEGFFGGEPYAVRVIND